MSTKSLKEIIGEASNLLTSAIGQGLCMMVEKDQKGCIFGTEEFMLSIIEGGNSPENFRIYTNNPSAFADYIEKEALDGEEEKGTSGSTLH